MLDLSAYAYALHWVVNQPVPSVPEYDEVMKAVGQATKGDYDAFKQLSLWYHKLPLSNGEGTPKHRLITEAIREGYQGLRRSYQRRQVYGNAHDRTVSSH